MVARAHPFLRVQSLAANVSGHSVGDLFITRTRLWVKSRHKLQ